jgi:hypothetical protein
MRNNQKPNHDQRRKRWQFIAIAGACLIAGNLLAADQTVNSLNKTRAKTSRPSVSAQSGAQINQSDVDVIVKRPSLARSKTEKAKLTTNNVASGESQIFSGGVILKRSKLASTNSDAPKVVNSKLESDQGSSLSRAEFEAAFSKAQSQPATKDGATNVNLTLEGN